MDTIVIFMDYIIIILVVATLFAVVPHIVVGIRNKIVLRMWRGGLKPGSCVQYFSPYHDKPVHGVIQLIDEDNRAIVYDPESVYICRVPIKKLYPWEPPKQKKKIYQPQQ